MDASHRSSTLLRTKQIIILVSLCVNISRGLPTSNSNKTPDRRSNQKTETEHRESGLLFNKKESCEAIPYQQEITVPGCKMRTVENRYCKGNCISGYVPENGVKGKYKCSSCQPMKIEQRNITLQCGENEIRVVAVEIFVSCKCQQSNCTPKKTTSTSNQGVAIASRKQTISSQTPNSKNKKKDEDQSTVEENLFDQERPCRYICRKCRKARREYEVLQTRKEKFEYLVKSCRTVECHKRIPLDDVIGIAKVQKRLKKAVCRECRECKERKSQEINA